MKKIFTLTLIAAVVLTAGCSKSDYYDTGENYWLSRERGEVVYSDSYCSYYVVETYYGFTIIRSYGGYKPYEGSVIYGDFNYRGTRDFYNRSTGYVFTGTVTDYNLDYYNAQYALEYYCPLAGKGQKREFKKSSFSK